MTIGYLTPDSDLAALVLGHVPGTENSTFQVPTILDTSQVRASGSHVLEPDFPIEALSHDAETTPSFFEDWYHRLHIIPQRLDLANVVSDQSRSVLVWNAFLVDKTVSSATYPTGAGITVTDNYGVPYTMRPLEDLEYPLVVSADGPPTIDTSINWIIGGVAFSVPITGRRIIVWPFGPDWRRPLVETLDWLTDIFTAFNGDEQRRELRSKPRRMFEYVAWVKKADAALMRNLLWGWQSRNFALPLWQDRTQLTVGAAAGATVVNAPTNDRSFFTGGLVVLINSAQDYEVVEVDSFDSVSITLTKALERPWPQGSKLYPVNICRMPTSASGRALTDGVHEVSLTFNADPLQTDPYIPVIAATTTHSGHEVILRRPNWASPITIDNQFDYLSVDFNTGGVLTEQSREYPMVNRKFQWVLKTRADITQFRAMLGRRRGRFNAAYVPSWLDDFELYAPVTASAVAIPVKNNEFAKMVGEDPALNTLMILAQGQAPAIRTISSVGTDPSGYTVLGLNAPIGFDLDSTTIQRLCLVHLCRLTSDRVTINWLTESVLSVESNFSSVKA